VGLAVGVGSLAGVLSVAGAGAGVAAGGGFTGADAGAGGGFTGTGAAVGCDATVSVPTALRTAATNGSAAWGEGTDPVRMLLKSTMRP